MRYTVAWRELALQQLAQIWMLALDREAVNRAVDFVDAELLNDPDVKGDDYFGDRYLTLDVMWVLYRVMPDDRIVHVLQVGRPGVDRPHENLPPVG
ncbi:MAG TPA: hypothetical protein VFG68_06170 [Fimbriiglobus sp.]|nr:hypothetical protein [Fimbriiglobus sp.]